MAVNLPLLTQGSSGQAVGHLQQMLNGHLVQPQLHVDNQYGPSTANAVRQVQQKANGAAGGIDGVCGALTWAYVICY